MVAGMSVSRSLVVGAFAGFVAVILAVVAVLVGTDTIGSPSGEAAPQQLLVVAITEDTDGATVAGIAFMVSPSGSVEQVDTRARVDIPGTTYDMVRDSYAFGGGAGVARAVAATSGVSDAPDWIVLPGELWIEMVDSVGGASIEVSQGVNAYVDGELFLIEAGTRVVSGSEIHALAAVAADSGHGTEGLGVELAQVVIDNWAMLSQAVQEDRASSSVVPERLVEFGSTF